MAGNVLGLAELWRSGRKQGAHKLRILFHNDIPKDSTNIRRFDLFGQKCHFVSAALSLSLSLSFHKGAKRTKLKKVKLFTERHAKFGRSDLLDTKVAERSHSGFSFERVIRRPKPARGSPGPKVRFKNLRSEVLRWQSQQTALRGLPIRGHLAISGFSTTRSAHGHFESKCPS